MPDAFKQADIRPLALLKKAGLNPNELSNYRPLSNLSNLSKLLERIVAKRIDAHLGDNMLREPHRAYTKHHSTETALINVHSDLLCALDQKKKAVLVLLDLSAAFDTIDHQHLIDCLKKMFGFRGTALRWMSSYLTGRVQSVVIGDSRSKPVVLRCGVPQGSVLGPKCFTMLTKPLGNFIIKRNISYHLYADDTQLYVAFDSVDGTDCTQIKESLELCLDDISKY